MNFPQFWARGGQGDFRVWRWSVRSLEEAQALAEQAAAQLADRFRAGLLPPKHGAYYPDRPFREQVLREFKNGPGELTAVLTRNSYGCLVLNTARVMFVDIDLPEPKRPPGFLKKLFGKSDLGPVARPETDALAKIERWTHANPEWGWRVYRTRAGLRLLATQAEVAPDSEITPAVFEALGADPLYRKLCTTQKCFRARLTPKPWRCGLYAKPSRWPWVDAGQEKRFEKWRGRYEAAAANWATCQFVRQIGNPALAPEVRSVITLHDTTTRIDSKLQLA